MGRRLQQTAPLFEQEQSQIGGDRLGTPTAPIHFDLATVNSTACTERRFDHSPRSRLPVSHRPTPLGWHAHLSAVPVRTARALTLHLPLNSTISQVTMDGKALRYALKLPSQRYALWRGAGPLTGPFASTRLKRNLARLCAGISPPLRSNWLTWMPTHGVTAPQVWDPHSLKASIGDVT